MTPSAQLAAGQHDRRTPARPITLYRWANRTASNTDYLIRNVEGFQYLDPNGNVIGTADPFRRYRAFMAVLNKRLTNRWQAQVSYVYAKAPATSTTPARRRSRPGSSRRRTWRWSTPKATASNTPTHEFKLLGSYQIPKIEASISAYFRGDERAALQRGSSSSRRSIARTPASVDLPPDRIEPRGTYHLPNLHQLDLRVEKNFNVARRTGSAIYMDIAEPHQHAATITSVVTRPTSVTLADGHVRRAAVRHPRAVQPPRQIRIGGRWSLLAAED